MELDSDDVDQVTGLGGRDVEFDSPGFVAGLANEIGTSGVKVVVGVALGVADSKLDPKEEFWETRDGDDWLLVGETAPAMTLAVGLNSALISVLFALLPTISLVDVETLGDSTKKVMEVRFPAPMVVLPVLLDAMGDPVVAMLIDSEVTVTVIALF